MKQTKCVLCAALLAAAALLLAMPACADFSDDFESGYTDGAILAGQNGWVNTQYGDDATSESDAGRLPGGLWGARLNALYNAGAKHDHGVSLVDGATITVASDIYLPSTRFARLGLMQTLTNSDPPQLGLDIDTYAGDMWIGFEVNGAGGWSRIHNETWADMVGDEWYKVTFAYTVGGGAEITMLRYSNGLSTSRIATAGEIGAYLSAADLASLNGIFIEGFEGVRYDNISATGPVVPEPASLSVLGLGLAGLLFRRRGRG